MRRAVIIGLVVVALGIAVFWFANAQEPKSYWVELPLVAFASVSVADGHTVVTVFLSKPLEIPEKRTFH
jgi:hypothetical protein